MAPYRETDKIEGTRWETEGREQGRVERAGQGHARPMMAIIYDRRLCSSRCRGWWKRHQAAISSCAQAEGRLTRLCHQLPTQALLNPSLSQPAKFEKGLRAFGSAVGSGRGRRPQVSVVLTSSERLFLSGAIGLNSWRALRLGNDAAAHRSLHIPTTQSTGF